MPHVFLYFIVCRGAGNIVILLVNITFQTLLYLTRIGITLMITRDILLALINEANPLQVPVSNANVTLSSPTLNQGTKNTKITVTAVDGTGYVGNIDVTYDRLAMAHLEPLSGMQSETPFTPESILSQLTNLSTTPLTLEDLDLTLPEMTVGDIVTIDVTAKANSLGWQGTASVSLLFGLPPTSDVLYDLMNHLLPAQ